MINALCGINLETFRFYFNFPQIQLLNGHWQKVKLLGLHLNAS